MTRSKYGLLAVNFIILSSNFVQKTTAHDDQKNYNYNILNNSESLSAMVKKIVPTLDHTKTKGDAGRICVIGGSIEYTGAPYFAAITSLKVGADLVTVIATEDAAPVIKSYSPELIVYPYLSLEKSNKISALIKRMDVIIIGPGLGRDDTVLAIASEIMTICRNFKKPLIVDADGLYLVSKNLSLVENYPSPGVILLPNKVETERLKLSMNTSGVTGFHKLGQFTSVLVKGKVDNFITSSSALQWSLESGGSGRRAGGQGDILAGSLGTFFNWAIKSNISTNEFETPVTASVASFGAATLTRGCNHEAFKNHGRSMTASDMINEIHRVFDKYFE